MKFRQFVILAMTISSLLLLICLVNAQQKSKPQWVYAYTDENHGWENYYDDNNITRTPQAVVVVHLKGIPIYKDEGEKASRINSLIKNREWLGLKPEGYERYAYSVTELEINCKTNEGRSISIADYDEAGKELGKSRLAVSEWAPVLPESGIGMLAEELCRQKK